MAQPTAQHPPRHCSVGALAVLLVVELALVYTFGSLAIARGSLWYYLFGSLFLIMALREAGRLLRHLIRRDPHTKGGKT